MLRGSSASALVVVISALPASEFASGPAWQLLTRLLLPFLRSRSSSSGAPAGRLPEGRRALDPRRAHHAQAWRQAEGPLLSASLQWLLSAPRSSSPPLHLFYFLSSVSRLAQRIHPAHGICAPTPSLLRRPFRRPPALSATQRPPPSCPSSDCPSPSSSLLLLTRTTLRAPPLPARRRPPSPLPAAAPALRPSSSSSTGPTPSRTHLASSTGSSGPPPTRRGQSRHHGSQPGCSHQPASQPSEAPLSSPFMRRFPPTGHRFARRPAPGDGRTYDVAAQHRQQLRARLPPPLLLPVPPPPPRRSAARRATA